MPRGKPPACIDRRQLCRKKFPLAGPDAPTPARGQGLQPYGALTLFFRWRKKSVQKNASGTATPEAARPAARRGLRPAVALRAVLVLGSLRSPAGKKPFIAHFDGGARYVARSGVGQLTHAIVRARSSPFSAVKMGGPFSLRCLSPLCSPAVGGRQTYLLQVKMVPTAWRSCSAKYEGFCFRRSRRGAGLPHARPASREARCRAAVASRPCRMSPERPARRRRAVRGAGVLPLLLVGGFPVFALGDFGNEGNAEGDDVFHDFL